MFGHATQNELIGQYVYHVRGPELPLQPGKPDATLLGLSGGHREILSTRLSLTIQPAVERNISSDLRGHHPFGRGGGRGVFDLTGRERHRRHEQHCTSVITVGIGCIVVNGVILTGCAVPVMSPLLS